MDTEEGTEEQEIVKALIPREIISTGGIDIGQTPFVNHQIPLKPNTRPIAHPPYRLNQERKDFLEKELDKMLEKGIIQTSESPWASPIVIVPKKTGDLRICVDYRPLNSVTVTDRYPIPNMQDQLENFRTAKYFTALDLASGYWQVKMHPDDQAKTAFITPSGLYEFKVMPFGLKNAPATFQRLMNRVLHRLIGKFCAVYLDDIIIYSTTFQDHCNHVQQVFARLKEAGLKIKPEKCTFVVNEVSYLGHIVGSNGIKPDQKKIQTMIDLPTPRNLKEVRMALGLFFYYRRFIQDFAKIARPLHDLTKRSTLWNWTTQHQDSFDELKFKMITAPVLI